MLGEKLCKGKDFRNRRDRTGGKSEKNQSVMSATDMLGHRDVRGLSAIDPHLRQWISLRTKPKDVDMPL